MRFHISYIGTFCYKRGLILKILVKKWAENTVFFHEIRAFKGFEKYSFPIFRITDISHLATFFLKGYIFQLHWESWKQHTNTPSQILTKSQKIWRWSSLPVCNIIDNKIKIWKVSWKQQYLQYDITRPHFLCKIFYFL